MSSPDEGSVAPTERVNIVYRPATGSAKEEVELPLKVLVMGEFATTPDTRNVESRQPINVDKDTFNEVLKAQQVALNFRAPDQLSGTPEAEINVALSFSTLNDFGPERVVAQVPELKALLEVRNALLALKGPLANIPEFKNKVQSLIKDEKARTQILKEIGIGETEKPNG